MINKFIRNFVAKQIAGRSDDGIMITLKDPQRVTFAENMLGDLLMRNGINPVEITSENQLKLILNRIKAAEARAIKNTNVSGIRNTESAKVFDMEGQEIPKGSKIMGGKAIDDDLPPPGSRGGDEDIAAPVQSQEETMKNMMEAEIKEKLEKQNKDSVSRILERKNREDVYGLEDYDTTNMSEIKKEIIRTETKLGNLNPNNPDFRERAKPLIDKITALQKKLREDKADGGRIGYSIGDLVMPDNDFMNLELPEDNDPYADIEGQTAFLDPISVASGLFKIAKGAKAKTLVNEFIRNKTKQKIGKEIYNKVQKKINPPKYGPPTSDIKPGRQISGGGREVSTNMGSVAGAQQDISNYQSFNEVPLRTGGRVGLKFGSGKKFLQKVFGAEKFAEMKTRDPEMYVGLLEVVDMYRKRDKEGLKMYLQKFLPHMDDAQIEDFIRGSDGSEGLIGELIRLGSGRDYQGKIEMMKRADEMKKLRDLEVTEDMIRKPNANGGIMRLGFKDGMNRRTFLKLLTGLAAVPIIGKVFKPLKVGKKVTQVPIIKTDNVPGKPEWFDQLVNKVILEGDDVTKRFATKDREIVHMKKLDEDTIVRVTQDMDEGAVRVEYQSPENVYGEDVLMQYKKPLPDEGDPRPSAEFATAESGPVGRVIGPDDVELDVDEVGGMSIKDLDSDVSKLKEYATGQKPTMKELVQNIKRRDKAARITDDIDGAASDAVVRRQGDFDPSDYDDGMASGGIARMLGE